MLQTTYTRAELNASGWSDKDIAGFLQDGSLRRLRHGVYSRAENDSPEDAHRRRIAATWKSVGDGNVLSHTSAGLLHGLPIRRNALSEVTLTRLTPGHGDRQKGTFTRHTRFTDFEHEVVDGYPVTTLARTVSDIARTEPPQWGLAAMDAALAMGLEPGVLTHAVGMHPRLKGLPRARRLLPLASPLAESPLESISRFHIVTAGLPTPVLQHEHVDGDGEVIARTDFYWPEYRLVGECDGMFKYTELIGPGDTTERAIQRQHAREQRLRELGLWVVNWGWQEVLNPASLVARLRRAFVVALQS